MITRAAGWFWLLCKCWITSFWFLQFTKIQFTKILQFTVKPFLLWKFKINSPDVLGFYPWETHQNNGFIKKKKKRIWPTDCCSNDWKGLSLLETPRIPKSIHLNVALAVSSQQAGGALSPLLAPPLYSPCSAWHWERWQEAAGCTVLHIWIRTTLSSSKWMKDISWL